MTRDDILKSIPFVQQHIERAIASVNAAATAKAEADSELNFAQQNLYRLQQAAATLAREPLTTQEEGVVSELVEYYLLDETPDAPRPKFFVTSDGDKTYYDESSPGGFENVVSWRTRRHERAANAILTPTVRVRGRYQHSTWRDLARSRVIKAIADKTASDRDAVY